MGLKPTRGRIPFAPRGEGWAGLSTMHAVTRSVRDSAALLDVIAFPDIGDPYAAPPITRPFAAEVNDDPGRLRIAFACPDAAGVTIDPACRQAVEHSAKLCADLGHDVSEAAPRINYPRMRELFMIIASSQMAATYAELHAQFKRDIERHEFEKHTWHMIKLGRKNSVEKYCQAIDQMQLECRKIAPFFEQYDVFLCPTVTRLPPKIGELYNDQDSFSQMHQKSLEFSPYCAVYNQTGQPAISLPLFRTENNLPIGSQFIARFGDEATLFRLSSQLEQIESWPRTALG